MDNKFKTKNILILSILIISLLSIISILFNFSFKYDKNDQFFRALILRSAQFDDKYVYTKFIESIMRVDRAFNKDFENKMDVFNHIKNGTFTNEYFRKILLDNVYKIKFDDKSFAPKYIDLYNREFKELNDSSFIKFATPNNISFALKITNPKCTTKIDIAPTNCGMGYIDINGKKGPNQLGVDLLDVGIYYYPINKNGPVENNNIVSMTTLYWQRQYYEGCLYGNGKGCTYGFVYGISRNNYLNKQKLFKSKYKFNPSYNHIYITPNGKWVFFNQSGFVDFVTLRGIFQNIESYKKFIVWYYLNPKKKEIIDKKTFVMTLFYNKYPKLKPKPKKPPRPPQNHKTFVIFGQLWLLEW